MLLQVQGQGICGAGALPQLINMPRFTHTPQFTNMLLLLLLLLLLGMLRLFAAFRYKDKAYVEQVHWQSGLFKAFQEACKEAGIDWVEKSVVTYEEADVGF
jgi:hypothetical protein